MGMGTHPSASRIATLYVQGTPERVAARYLEGKEWGDPHAMIAGYTEALVRFQNAIDAMNQDVSEGVIERPNPYILRRYFVPVINNGRPLAEWVLQTRTIPGGKTKAIELAARLMGASRVPADLMKWYDTNHDRLDFLLEASSWGERSATSEGGLDVATAGAFKVHNTIGATEKQFKEILGLVESATKALTPMGDFKKVLYGDVYVVGQLKQSRTLAWYSIKADDVYLRSLAKKGIDDLASLIHELGHRYWFRFMPRDQKQKVANLFFKLSSQGRATQIERPKVGEPLPIPVRGQKEPPVVTKDTGRTFELSTGGYVNAESVLKILQQQAAAKGGVFPSVYSMKDYDEFFAECFAFYTMGRMKPELEAQFTEALK